MIKEKLEPEVLYEDANMLVISKPTGMMVHADGRREDKTVVDWFLARAPEAREVGEPGFAQDGSPLLRAGVVHRLDEDTSGLLVLAKTQDAFLHLKTQFQEHLIKKEYRAFVYGTMKEKWGTINRLIGRSTKDFRLRSAQRGARGTLRSAITDWELIGQTETHAYLKLLPKTGRTHQLRVHMKAIGRPIVKDDLYASENLLLGNNLGFTRLALHAYSLKFMGIDGIDRHIIAPIPPDFEAAETTLATP